MTSARAALKVIHRTVGRMVAPTEFMTCRGAANYLFTLPIRQRFVPGSPRTGVIGSHPPVAARKARSNFENSSGDASETAQ
jgi:hypothetical protein